MNEKLSLLIKRLEKYPEMIDRMDALLDIVENTSGEVEKANEAERRAIVEIKKMGIEVITFWAKSQELKKTEELLTKDNAIKHGKKKHIG